MATIAEGSICYLEYQDAAGNGLGLFQERLVASHIQDDEYMIVTPDFDIYVEQLSALNNDLNRFRLPGAGGGLPPGIPEESIYGFGMVSRVTTQQLLAEARHAAEGERRARGLGAAAPAAPANAALVPVGGPPPGAPAGAVVAAPSAPMPIAAPAAASPAIGAVSLPVPLPRIAGVGGTWVLDEPTGTHDVGTEVSLPPGTVPVQDRALVLFDNAPVVVRLSPQGTEINTYVRERTNLLMSDRRLLPLVDPAGPRPTVANELSYSRASLPPAGMAGPMLGPDEGCEHVLDAMAAAGTSFVARTSRWRAESGVSSSSPCVWEHEVLSTALEYFTVYDRLNVRNLVGA